VDESGSFVRSDIRGRSLDFPMKDKHGREYLIVAVKYVFVVDALGRVEIDEKGVDPYLADVCWGDDPATSSIKKPSDLFDYKPGTDVILVGHAIPPPNRPPSHVDVSLRVGPIAKTVRAHGLRVWQSSAMGGLTPGPALPMREPVPLTYELAWGGFDISDPEKAPVGEPRNYLGRGVVRDWKRLVDQPAALLEDPSNPIGGKKNVPWCFGALHRHWQPRVSFVGTYDSAWMETKMPLPPDDFDPKFNVCVTHDQWSQAPLRGDESVEVVGARQEGPWRFQLPRIALGFSSTMAGRGDEQHRAHLDTFLVDADAGRVELTWRTQIPMPRKYEMVEDVRVFEKEIV
jgi:hypothetical protein